MQELRFTGGAVLRPSEAQVLVKGRPVPLGGRAYEVLCALAEKPGQLVTKRELMDRVWPDVVVEENNLQVQISTLRRVLGPGAIVTVAGRGYRLVAECDRNGASAAAEEADGGQEPAGAPPLAPSAPLLERQDALAVLARALESARRGQGAVCLVYGEAGIGKSSLCNAFLAPLRDIRVLRGVAKRCSRPGRWDRCMISPASLTRPRAG